MSANMLIPIFSPIIGGYINESFDWRAINLFYAFIGTILLFFTIFLLKETNIYKNQGNKIIIREFFVLFHKTNTSLSL